MSNDSFDLVIVGAGIVGLSVAMQMRERFPRLRIAVLEKESAPARHQTGHNSGVIHSGVYYRPGSMKARMCVEGAATMVAFCSQHGLPYEICGKVIVATSQEELPALQEIYRRAEANGVPNVALISPERLRELEPHATGAAALYVPGTGIADFAAVARKYAELFTAAGGEVRIGAEVQRIQPRASEIVVETSAGEVTTRFLINCAGLQSDMIARAAGIDPEVRIVPFRGEYYEMRPESSRLVRALIYPVPDARFPFLGVHFTKKVRGGVEAGPNAVLALGREGYRKLDINLADLGSALAFPGFWRMAAKYWRMGFAEMYRSFSKPAFMRALQKLVPEIRSQDLRAGGAGVRAQALDRDGKLLDDFYFVERERMIHVLNVPSPAATASLVIGRTIVNMAGKNFGLL